MGFEDPFFVQFYEEIDGRKSDDLDFYLALAKASAGPVLDCGCGSGRILLPISTLGIATVGFDASEAMLGRLREELSTLELNPAPRLLHASMQSIDRSQLPDQFGLVICAFNTFLHLMTQREQIAFLKKMRSMVRPGGKLVIDVVNPFSHDMFTMSESEPEFEHTIVDPATEEEITTWRSISQQMIEQTGTFHREHEITDANGKKRTAHSEVAYRWVYPTEMALLLELAGFTSRQVYGDYYFGALTSNAESQIWIATAEV